MASWQQVVDYLASNYKIASMSDDRSVVKMIFGTGMGRSQVVLVIYTGGSVRIDSVIGEASRIDARRLLELTDAPDKYMGVQKFSTYYVVTHRLLIEDLSPAELEGPLNWVIEEADSYEMQLGLGDKH